jgi:phenylalanyl-tRNA synthetase alpha chain
MKDLVGTMDLMFKTLYGPDVVVRYRAKYYPEVEPGVGPDMQCFKCHGTGCPLCKYAGWIEMGGSGIIHPKVLQKAGIDPRSGAVLLLVWGWIAGRWPKKISMIFAP